MDPLTMTWFDKVKACVGWDLTDQARMASLRRCLDSDITQMIEVLGTRLAQFKGTQSLMANARFVQRLHGVLREWLTGLLDAAFDGDYIKRRWAFGQELAETDLTFEDFILLEGLARGALHKFAQSKLGQHPQVFSSAICALDKALSLDRALIYTAYLEIRDAEMERVLLDRFLTITGFSRTLYENLAEARGWGRNDR